MRTLLATAVPDAGQAIVLAGEENHYALHVLRLARGERVRVTGRDGRVAVARMDGMEGAHARLVIDAIVEASVQATPARIVLLGRPKPALLEEALTLGTEAGATAFHLVEARRSPPGNLREDRAARILDAAVKQCLRPDVPALLPAVSLGDALARLGDTAGLVRWICDAGGDAASPVAGPLVLAIGPEGGWDEDERASLHAAGFERVTLGPHVLRNPTAVAVALGRSWGTG